MRVHQEMRWRWREGANLFLLSEPPLPHGAIALWGYRPQVFIHLLPQMHRYAPNASLFDVGDGEGVNPIHRRDDDLEYLHPIREHLADRGSVSGEAVQALLGTKLPYFAFIDNAK